MNVAIDFDDDMIRRAYKAFLLRHTHAKAYRPLPLPLSPSPKRLSASSRQIDIIFTFLTDIWRAFMLSFSRRHKSTSPYLIVTFLIYILRII